MSYSLKGWTTSTSTSGPFAFDFPYLSRADLVISVNGVPQVGCTFTTPYTFYLPSTVPAGTYVEVRRKTSRSSRLVNFQNTSGVTEYELDLSADQCFMVAQEAFDELELSSVKVIEDGTLSATGRRISNVGNPVNPQDVVTKAHGDALYGGAVSGAAISARDAAIAARDAAQASATSAATSASNAASAATTAANAIAADLVRKDGTTPFTSVVQFPRGGLRPGGEPSFYESPEQAVRTTVGAYGPFTHGATSAPVLVKAFARCKVADMGYAVGEEVEVPLFFATQSYGVACWASSTQLGGIQGHTVINLWSKTTSIAAQPTAASWRIFFRAYWL